MAGNRVGGAESNARYFGVFLLGVLLGSSIRVVAFLFPNRVVRRLEDTLLGDLK